MSGKHVAKDQPATFEFDANGLVIFNQPILSNNKPSDDDELPF